MECGKRKMERRVLKVSVLPEGESLFSERSTEIEIEDEGAGEFVKVRQEGGHTDYSKHLLFDPDEWPSIRDAIDQMIGECRGSEQ